MQLIYLSPVPWFSFAQRPHKFVTWFQGRTGDRVLWVDPYPTRFPLFSDFRRLGSQSRNDNFSNPPWLTVIKPVCIPIEPLPASGLVNAYMWKSLLKDVDKFYCQQPTLLVIGKPSVLGLAILKQLKGAISVYDAMDDFPAFYNGLSRYAMIFRERKLVKQVRHLLVSSTALMERWQKSRADVQLVHNGLDTGVLPVARTRISDSERNKVVLGYVGTIGTWFDWDWVINLARCRPLDAIRLVGPVFAAPPCALPKNIELLPPCEHQEALHAMLDFDVGLIPFKKNELTASVDPIKFYEYRALGLPVISTAFGEMALRSMEEGTYLSLSTEDIGNLVQEALQFKTDKVSTQKFALSNSWESRFEATNIFQ